MTSTSHSTTSSETFKLIFSSPSVARSEDGNIQIRPSRGDGNGIDRYSFSIRDKGEIYLAARNTFDKDDNCTIHIGLATLDANIGYLRIDHEDGRQRIINMFSKYLFEFFILQFYDERDSQGNLYLELTQAF